MFENHPRPVARVALAGCGCRGASMLPLLLEMEDVRVTAVCDPYLDKAEACAEQVRKAYGEPCAVYTDYTDLITCIYTKCNIIKYLFVSEGFCYTFNCK